MKNLKKIVFSFGVLLSLVAGLQSVSAVGETLPPNEVRKRAQASWKSESSDRLALQKALCDVLNKIAVIYGHDRLPQAIVEIKAEALSAISNKDLELLEELLLWI